MKVGTEVEGRLIGLRTLFIASEELLKLTVDVFNGLKKEYNISQLYISDHYGSLNLQSKALLELSEVTLVTVELTMLSPCPDYVNIMLVVNNSSFWKLRPDDQIKFSKELKVYCMSKRNMTVTNPEDFEGDILL